MNGALTSAGDLLGHVVQLLLELSHLGRLVHGRLCHAHAERRVVRVRPALVAVTIPGSHVVVVLPCCGVDVTYTQDFAASRSQGIQIQVRSVVD